MKEFKIISNSEGKTDIFIDGKVINGIIKVRFETEVGKTPFIEISGNPFALQNEKEGKMKQIPENEKDVMTLLKDVKMKALVKKVSVTRAKVAKQEKSGALAIDISTMYDNAALKRIRQYILLNPPRTVVLDNA